MAMCACAFFRRETHLGLEGVAIQMTGDISQSEENAKKQIAVIYQRCFQTKWGDCSETDTSTKFIHPLLQALGWNILDFNDVREEVLAKPKGKDRHIDLVLYSKGKPYIGIEIKSLSRGPINDLDKDAVQYWTQELLEKSRYLDVKYAILTRFYETIIYDSKTGNKLASFNHPKEYLEKFDCLWKYLSKPRTDRVQE